MVFNENMWQSKQGYETYAKQKTIRERLSFPYCLLLIPLYNPTISS